MQPFDRLVDNVDIGIYGAVGCEHLNHLMRNLVLSEGGIHSFHAIDKLRVRLRLLLNAVTVGIVEDMLHATLPEQLYRCPECDELAHPRHVDAIVIGVTHLRGGGHHDNLSGMQAVEHTEDGLLKGGATHNAVVNDHKIIHAILDNAVGDIVDVSRKIVARLAFGNECAELYILYGDLLDPQVLTHYLLKPLLIEGACHLSIEYLCGLDTAELLFKA